MIKTGLVLTRTVGTSIAIGPDVRVTLDRISGKQVRLRVRCPRDIHVDRLDITGQIEEIYKERDEPSAAE